MYKHVLHWFRNDLRLHDHEVLANRLKQAECFLPVFCIDPDWFRTDPLGFPKTGAFRAQFLLESLQDLDHGLRKLGSRLYVVTGKPERVLAELASGMQADVVYAQQEDTDEEIIAEQAVASALDCPLELFQGRTLFHPDDLPFPLERLPDVFTNFRKKMEKYAEVRPSFDLPQSLPALPGSVVFPEKFPDLQALGMEPVTPDARGVMRFKGGERAGMARLDSYFWDRKLLHTYKDTRNGMLGEAYSSKFSPWLANGSLSPRLIYEAVKAYEAKIQKNQSTYWLIFELMWRDYFRYVALRYGKRIFYLSGIRREKPHYRNRREDFEAWMNGTIGEPFVDANMLELKQTGFMSNRGRQNVASYLTKDLKVDWRWGAAWFESQLVDYDVCSNWGNWMYVAGVGNDPRENRYFNVRKQAERYDPKGEYVNHWLSKVPE